MHMPEPEPESGPEAKLATAAALAVGAVPAPAASALPSAAEYCRHGISIDGLEHFAREHGVESGSTLTTSDICHQIIKPATVPAGWEDLATLTHAGKRWYSHEYRDRATGALSKSAPEGTSGRLASADFSS